MLASVVSLLTVMFSVAAGLAFRRRFPGSGVLFYLAVASLVMPSLLVGFGIGLGFKALGWKTDLFTSALGAQLTWTLPFGLFAMFAVVNRFNRSYEEAANDLGASPWQRFRYVTLPILLPGIIGVGMGAFTLSYDEYARTTLVIGERNTLPLEIYALISSATSPMLFAIGTVTTAVSFLVIGLALWRIFHIQKRRAGAGAPRDENERDRLPTGRRRGRNRASMSSWSPSPSATTGPSRSTRSRCASRRPATAACWARAAAARPAPCA